MVLAEGRPKGQPVLETRSLVWSVGGRDIVAGIDLGVGRGECVAIIGPNGAGKTSLLRLLSGLRSPTSGDILLDGERLPSLPRREVARRIAYVPQLRPNRIPLSVEQMVLLGRYPHWSGTRIAPAAEDFVAVRAALERVGLGGLAERRMDRLSGGEQQGVFLAACLAQEAPTLILDEPTTHLDPRHQRQIASLVLKLNREEGLGVVLATHDLNFAAMLAHRVVALLEGEVVGDGPPGELLRPEKLTELFQAPFTVVREGARPVTLLEMDP